MSHSNEAIISENYRSNVPNREIKIGAPRNSERWKLSLWWEASLNGLKYWTDFNYAATLEFYHSFYNKPTESKRLNFSYLVMIARAQLAVLDFNSGVGLAHRKNKQGDIKYKHQFSKITQSWVVTKICERKKRQRTKIVCMR